MRSRRPFTSSSNSFNRFVSDKHRMLARAGTGGWGRTFCHLFCFTKCLCSRLAVQKDAMRRS
jgi:hypothetical protein